MGKGDAGKPGIIAYIALGGFVLLRAFVRLLNPRLAAFVGGAIGGVVAKFCRKERRVSLTQLQFAASGSTEYSLKLRKHRLEEIPTGVFRHLGNCVVELFLADRLLEELPEPNPEIPWAPAFKNVSFSAHPRLQEILEQEIASVALTGHIGCFELLAPFYAKIGYQVSVFRRRSNYPVVELLHADFLRWTDVQILWREDPQTKKKLMKTLRCNKQVIAALVDQDIDLENSFVPFFGLEAATPYTVVKAAIRLKRPIFSTFIVRTAPLQHHVQIDVLEYDADDPAAVDNVLVQYNAQLEELIARHPEQWIWWHRRWRRRPGVDYQKEPDRLRGTSEYLEWLESERSSS